MRVSRERSLDKSNNDRRNEIMRLVGLALLQEWTGDLIGPADPEQSRTRPLIVRIDERKIMESGRRTVHPPATLRGR